jgi:hypothetical protein
MVAGCAPDEEDAGLILSFWRIAQRARWQGDHLRL